MSLKPSASSGSTDSFIQHGRKASPSKAISSANEAFFPSGADAVRRR